MHFVIVPDSFKNCLPANKVGEYIGKGIHQVYPDSVVKTIPMADGGEGTVKAIINATGGTIIDTVVHDPLMRKIDSYIGILPDNKTAVIEMAAASGIELISSAERNPMETTTYGTGELIKTALDNNCQKIIIGIGGSATNDGGIGMAMALGAKFTDKNNVEVPLGGKGLMNVEHIDSSGIDSRLVTTSIKVACDVKNTLCGSKGASTVYGPQKGADKEMIEKLDKGLNRLALLVKEKLNIEIENIPGGGAAGGLGAGLIAFTGGELTPGFNLIADTLNLEEEIKKSDIVISAEGAIDFQTQFGKTPAGVATIAKKYNKPIFVFAGSAAEDASEINPDLIDAIIPITRRPVDLETAINNAPNWLIQSAKELCKIINASIRLNRQNTL